MAWPLPPPAVAVAITRAPARRATAAVSSSDPSSTTTMSSTRSAPPTAVRVARTLDTIGPRVPASLRAGRHTATCRPARAATRAGREVTVAEAAQGSRACLARSGTHDGIIPHPGPGHAHTPAH